VDTFIRFRCPGCNAGIKAPPQLLGHLRACPGCGRRFIVHRQAPDDAGPLLARDGLVPRPRLRVRSR
jgi:hypothetical protein